MSIRTVQTKFRTSPTFNVLTAIDTNSPPGLAYRAQEIEIYFEKPSQPSYSSSTGSLAPSPVIHPGSFSRRSAAGSSTLSPYASPYKPRSTPRTTSQFQTQNQYQQQTQRAGARVGRGIPAVSSYGSQGLDSEFPGVHYSYTSSQVASGGLSSGGGSNLSMDPIFNGIPSYSLSSRFDPFGDYPASEKTSIPSSKNRTPFSPLTPTPANSKALTQSPGAGTGSGPAYTHYYYYDKTTNSPMLAYGSRQSNRINFNSPRNQWNHKARGNSTPTQYNNRRPNNSFTPSRSPSPPSALPAPSHASFISLPNTTSSRSPSPPSPSNLSLPPPPVTFPVNPKADTSVDPFADPLPAPVRTRKRSNAFREAPKQPVQPMKPSSSPPLPEIKPKVSEKKNDSSMVSKLVAAMLLNRVDASGRSRCAGSATKRLGLGGGYVKSNLSRVVAVEF